MFISGEATITDCPLMKQQGHLGPDLSKDSHRPLFCREDCVMQAERPKLCIVIEMGKFKTMLETH